MHASLPAFGVLQAIFSHGFPVPEKGHLEATGTDVVVDVLGRAVDVEVVVDGPRARHAGSSAETSAIVLSLNCRQYARPTSWHATLFASLSHASLRQGFPVVPRNGQPPATGPAVVVSGIIVVGAPVVVDGAAVVVTVLSMPCTVALSDGKVFPVAVSRFDADLLEISDTTASVESASLTCEACALFSRISMVISNMVISNKSCRRPLRYLRSRRRRASSITMVFIAVMCVEPRGRLRESETAFVTAVLAAGLARSASVRPTKSSLTIRTMSSSPTGIDVVDVDIVGEVVDVDVEVVG